MNLMKTPRSLDLAITNRCNLRCAYCSHFNSPGEVLEDLDKDEWLRFLEELNSCSVLQLTLEGGEPFYRKDLKDLIEGIVHNRMRFDILSNGTLIDDDIAAFLDSSGRCNGVQVSIDGSGSESHDVFRGEGSFNRAINGIKVLMRNKIPITVRVTIHRKNVRDLDGIAELLLDEIGLSGFSTNSASFLGSCRRNTEQVQLTPEEHSLAMKTLVRLNKRYQGRISASAGPLAEARSWLMMERARIEKKGAMPGRGYLIGCGGPMTSLAVRADGVIVPCSQMSHIELGMINRDSLKDIWQNHPELKRLRERRSIPLSDFEFCRGCDYIGYCSGNCPALAYTAFGDECHPSPDGCLKRFLEEGGSLPETGVGAEYE
jgi:SynChlorMet cassette radical SAM/SPASM protein ScmE